MKHTDHVLQDPERWSLTENGSQFWGVFTFTHLTNVSEMCLTQRLQFALQFQTIYAFPGSQTQDLVVANTTLYYV